MYIAIEGIKGSGKSTVYTLLCERLRAERREFVCLQPAQPVLVRTPIEWIFCLTAPYWPDWLVERLYAWRSNYHAQRIPKRHGLILGERSILTSYVTRWDARNPERGMAIVDALEYAIPVPDQVIYLHISVEQALTRLAARPRRTYGLRDETPQRLHQAANAYKTLLIEGKHLGLSYLIWHVVDATAPVAEVLEHIIRVVEARLPESWHPRTQVAPPV